MLRREFSYPPIHYCASLSNIKQQKKQIGTEGKFWKGLLYFFIWKQKKFLTYFQI